MEDRYFLTDHLGNTIGPLTARELNAESQRGRLAIPETYPIRVEGSSVVRSARQIEGLTIQTAPLAPSEEESQKTDRAAAWFMGGLVLFLLVAYSLRNDHQTSSAAPAPVGLVGLTGFYAARKIHAGESSGFLTGLVLTGLSVSLGVYGIVANGGPVLPQALAIVPFAAMFGYCAWRLSQRRPNSPRLYIDPSLLAKVKESTERFRSEDQGPLPAPDAVDPVATAAGDEPVQDLVAPPKIVDGLERLAQLRRERLLTEDEYRIAKTELLGGDHA